MSNQMKIKVVIGHVLTESVLNGIDTSNIIASNVNPYTATQDCIACVLAASLKLNETQLGAYQATPYGEHYVELKKGDVIQSNSGYGNVIQYVFGIKR